jgi:16S rRNA (uracil1498-N3)-methyltransferase
VSRERRFFVDDIDATSIALDLGESHHLVHVLRLREGAEVSVFDGKGRAALARVLEIDGDSVKLQPVSPEPSRESSLALAVAIAPPKGDRMSLVVQKLTELGAVRIVPLVTDRGEVSRDRCTRSLERWRRVALEACKQCGRSFVPGIETPRDLSEISAIDDDSFTAFDRVLMAEPGAGPLPPIPSPERLLVLVGPEGGWSEPERALADARGLTRFGLGPRTLRTETAAIAAASVLQFLFGDWKVSAVRG